MIKAVKEKFFNLIKKQDGVALPIVLAMFAIGSLMIVPSINYVATNLKAGTMAKEEFKGILAADAGVEDALWKIKNATPASFPYSYQITNINGLSVDITIDEIDTIAGEEVGEEGTQDARLIISENVTYDAVTGNYIYKLSLYCNHSKNIKIVKILIDFTSGIGYVDGSTSSNVTEPVDADPNTIIGNPSTGITVVWRNSDIGGYPTISGWTTEYHYFKLSGPPGMEEEILESNGFVEAVSSDVGTVWIGDFVPYAIIAQAKDDSGAVVATIRAGVWGGDGVLASISCWQVIP